MFLANMRMATKLGAGFALVTLLTLALGSISLWQMRQMDASTRAVVQHAMPSVVDVSSLRELWSRLRRAEAGILNVNSVAEVDGYVAQITRVQEEIQAHERSYESLARQPQEQQLWERYQQLRGQYAQTHASFVQQARDKDYSQPEGDLLLGDAVTNFYVGTAEPAFVNLLDALGQLSSVNREQADQTAQEAARSYQFAVTWVLLGMGLSAAVALVWGWWITRTVTVPVKQAVHAALLGLLDESRGGGYFGSALFLFLSFLLPLECACPILVFIFIKLGFPPAYWLFAGGSCMVFGMASHAVAVFDIVKQLTLEFAGNQLAIHGGSKVRAFQAGRQRRR
jgi:CHASE3 domain sensor protein